MTQQNNQTENITSPQKEKILLFFAQRIKTTHPLNSYSNFLENIQTKLSVLSF